MKKINDTATAYTEELFSDAGVTGAAAANFAKYKLRYNKRLRLIRALTLI